MYMEFLLWVTQMGTEFCNAGQSLSFGSVASRGLKASTFYHPDLFCVFGKDA